MIIARVRYPERGVACTVSKLIQAYDVEQRVTEKKETEKRKEKLELLHYTKRRNENTMIGRMSARGETSSNND